MASVSVQDVDLTKWDVLSKLDARLLEEIEIVMFFGLNGDSALFVTRNDDVYGVGKNVHSKLGIGDADVAPLAVKIPSLCGKRVSGFACGMEHAVAVTEGGEVYGWGDNSHGQLGQGNQKSSSVPLAVPFLRDVTYVTCGRGHNLALTRSGEIYAWGNNERMRCGVSGPKNMLSPVRVEFPPGTVVSNVSCGRHHSVALTTGGKIFTWGFNKNGELGWGKASKKEAVVGLVDCKPDGGFTKVSCGAFHTLALTGRGDVYTWGHNKFQILSVTSGGEGCLSPEKISGLHSRVKDIMADKRYYISLVESECGVYFWGAFGSLPDSGEYVSVEEEEVFQKPTGVPARNVIGAFHNRQTPALRIKLKIPTFSGRGKTWLDLPPLFDKQDHSDIKISVRGKDIACHKLILKLSCPFFEEILNEGDINITDYSPNAYYNFIKYIYTKSIECDDLSGLIEMLKISKEYNYEEFKASVTLKCKFIMGLENIIELYKAAEENEFMELRCFCLEYMSENFKDLAKTEGYKNLNGDVVKELTIQWAKGK